MPTETPIQRFRLRADLWRRLGDLVGERGRSGQLQEFVEWRLANPHAPLPDKSDGETVMDFLVRIRVGAQGRRAEVLPFAGATTRAILDLRAEIVAAIVEHFQRAEPATPARPARKKTTRKATR